MMTAYAPEAEQALIGSCLLNGDALLEVIDLVKPADFSSWRHQVVFEAMATVLNQHGRVDLALVANQLRGSNAISNLGGEQTVEEFIHEAQQLTREAATRSQIRAYAEIIQNKALSRALDAAGDKIRALGQEEDAREALDKAQQILADVTLAVESEEKTLAADYADNALERIRASLTNKTEGHGISTGFRELDKLTKGLKRGKFWTIAGRTSMGKTSFALCMMLNILKQTEMPVLFFSLETERTDLLEQMIKIEAETDTNIGKMEEAAQRLKPLPLHIFERVETVPAMRLQARKLLMKYGKLGAIFLDHLHIADAPGAKTLREKLVSITRELKRLAIELDVPVIALAQINREVEKQAKLKGNKDTPDYRPRIADIKESGSIEQDSDVLLLLYRDEYYTGANCTCPGEAEVIIAKQRHGPRNKTVKLSFRDEITRFYDLPEVTYAYQRGGAVEQFA